MKDSKKKQERYQVLSEDKRWKKGGERQQNLFEEKNVEAAWVFEKVIYNTWKITIESLNKILWILRQLNLLWVKQR